MKLPILGGCLCGSIRYEITQLPRRMGICYCRSCQLATGSSHFPFVASTADALTINGSVTWYQSVGHTGNKIYRGFCSQCGSTLFGKMDALPQHRSVAASSLDNSHLFKPEIAVWTDDALSWSHIDPSLKKFEKNPF